MNEKALGIVTQGAIGRARRIFGRTKGYLLSQFRVGIYALAYRTALPHRWRRRLLGRFWDHKAVVIHSEWGGYHHDFGILGDIIVRYRPVRLLDIGCGSGRLFPLYRQYDVAQVVGIDISDTALNIAREVFPGAELHSMDLTELNFPDDAFDFCVCNRVLQHILPDDIREVIGRLGRMCRMIYVNELTESDDMDEAFFMRRYDYHGLFAELGMFCLETGSIGKQTFLVFAHGPVPNLSHANLQ